MAGEHPWDGVAEDLVRWLDTAPREVAQEFMGGSRAPFSAAVTDKQKLAYYKRQFFNPDGSDNHDGRSAELKRVGTKGFVDIYNAVMRGHTPTTQETP